MNPLLGLDREGLDFIPIAFDSLGAFALKASGFLASLATYIMAEKGTNTDSGSAFERAFRTIHSKWRRRISVALQRETVRWIIFRAARSPDSPTAAPTTQSEYLMDPGPSRL